jgi:hypothetical protein
MKMFTGHQMTNDEQHIDAREVRFVTDDGREAFAVRMGADGKSVEVRGIDTFKVNGELRGSTLQAIPRSSNVLTIEARRYDEN